MPARRLPIALPFLAFLLATPLLAGCTGPADAFDVQSVQGAAGPGGGSVANAVPTWRGFTADKAGGDNTGSFAVTFSGSVFDANAESHLAHLVLTLAGPTSTTATHAVTAAEVALPTEPQVFGTDGFKVWGGAANDGVLEFRYKHAFPAGSAPGTYTVTAVARDRVNATTSASTVNVTVARGSIVTIATAPVDPAGRPLAGAAWGGWSAAPGARNVSATNYLKVTNDGDTTSPVVVLDFTDAAFVGEDGSFKVPIDGNIRFSWAEGRPGSKPSDMRFQTTEISAEGTITVAFTGKGNVAYVAYTLTQLPEILPAQAYRAAFTVTEL